VHLKNHEGREDFNIPPDWHAARPPGISAFIRVRNEEVFIAACLLAVKDFFDEILVALNNCTDATQEIIAGLALPNVRVVEYPFPMHHNGPGHDDIPADSLHDNSYYYNWLLAQTRFSHACKWDADMIALPCMDARLREMVLASNVVGISGVNIVGDAMAHVSRDHPEAVNEPRFFRIAPHTFYRQKDITQYFTHGYRVGLRDMQAAAYLHLKYCRGPASYTRTWPKEWRELERYRRAHEYRHPGPVYDGPYPSALGDLIIERALRRAGEVQPLKSQETILRNLGAFLLALRNQGLRGDIVEIGSFRGQGTVFLARLAESFIPEYMVYSVDPYSEAGAEQALHLEDNRTIADVYERFKRTVQGLQNHRHLHMTSHEAAEDLPDGILLAFVDGDHSYEGVKADFAMLVPKMQEGGVFAFDDYRNGAWPGVGQAYEEIRSGDELTVIHEDGKAAFLRKGGPMPEAAAVPLCRLQTKRRARWRPGIRTGLRKLWRRLRNRVNSSAGPAQQGGTSDE
jgi:predicted O-methyltransferase YrrM